MSNSVIHFTKMHGAGNDYIYVNTIAEHIPNPQAAAMAWSRPHFGIGSDGLVLIGAPSDASKADFSMRIFNADGSEAMMCGNASRCIGKYLYEKGLTSSTSIRLETLSGVKVLKLHLAGAESGQRHVESVTVDMLEPRFDVPQQFNSALAPVFQMGTTVVEGTFVCMGNPHYVFFVDDPEQVALSQVGPCLENDQAFPERCNIEFAAVRTDGTIRTRVWERGSGITMACGTGACATAVAAAITHRRPRQSTIVMDGGDLNIAWSEHDNHVYLTGPAEFTFEGTISLPQ